MESKRQVGPSSSLSADIFGEKESPPSLGTFTSIFPPPQTVAGRNLSPELTGSPPKQSPGNQAWNSRQANFSGGASGNMPSRDGPIFGQERVEPCHLSSSIYYGGQDVYSQSPSTQKPGSYPIFKKDGEKDDPNGANTDGASRGNWWQGILLDLSYAPFLLQSY
ncbi:hypothetical protein CDL15_Pgr010386 [Punica granatum]|uniref:Uncharacterized protein n=1 Tax=Punica granatum TaxID=22663 RepID=A0A218W1U6_PUNGR|nr:hypothetical protein CDL15_Pgr010386 [Punica granatum]